MAEDLDRIAELVARYADLPLGGADGSLIALAELTADDDRVPWRIVDEQGGLIASNRSLTNIGTPPRVG